MKYLSLLVLSTILLANCAKNCQNDPKDPSCKVNQGSGSGSGTGNPGAGLTRSNVRKLTITGSLETYLINSTSVDPDNVCVTLSDLSDGTQIVDIANQVCPASGALTNIQISFPMNLSGQLTDTRTGRTTTNKVVGAVTVAQLKIPNLCTGSSTYTLACSIQTSGTNLTDVVAP